MYHEYQKHTMKKMVIPENIWGKSQCPAAPAWGERWFYAGAGDGRITNDTAYNERAEIMREKDTNRSWFLRGQVDKYIWMDFGDSYLPSDMNAAYLWAQREEADAINNDRLATWNVYYEALLPPCSLPAESNCLWFPLTAFTVPICSI